MRDCPNVEMRERLPDLVHETLAPPVAAEVEAHVAVCADCEAELALLRAIRAAAYAPVVDVTRIVAAIPVPVSASTSTPTLTSVSQSRRFGWLHPLTQRSWQIAAVLVLATTGITTLSLVRSSDRTLTIAPGTTAMNGTSSSPESVVAHGNDTEEGVAIVGVADLSDEHLEQLIHDMEQLDATPPSELRPLMSAPVPVAVGDQWGV